MSLRGVAASFLGLSLLGVLLGPGRGAPTRLCIQHEGATPVVIYTVEGEYVGRTPRASGGCVPLPDYVVRAAARLCVTTLGEWECVPLPPVVWDASPEWELRLRAFFIGWPHDVLALRPTRRAARHW